MDIEYVIAGGQIYFDKLSFAKELLLPGSPLKILLGLKPEGNGQAKPAITKTENMVTLDFNGISLKLDEGFLELFKHLKAKHQGKMKGRINIRIGFMTSYYTELDFSSEDGKVYMDKDS
jgi:hypothetical protein